MRTPQRPDRPGLGRATGTQVLHRGLREILAHHVIFHTNRAGMSVPDLSIMAALAMTDIFGFPVRPHRRRLGRPQPVAATARPVGRLVVPLRLRGAASRSIVFTRDDTSGTWRSIDSQLAVFMPLRGALDDARRTVELNPEDDVTLQVNKDQPVVGDLLSGVLSSAPHTVWTDAIFPRTSRSSGSTCGSRCACPARSCG
ncbi:hypothetical protein AB0K00_22680 [Dactylosporangium sp. NPDC049525]|uniref:hypothetical protein n=1 Tax=Dactylosporangium sp. NPDC049525 TaxID=3154730 RepID=UPI003439C544